jgi:hypothetical protein
VVEQKPEELRVDGSIPSLGTNIFFIFVFKYSFLLLHAEVAE